MTSIFDEKLKEIGFELPKPSVAAANYVPFTVSGNLVFISGQLPIWEGELKFKGALGRDFTVEEGQMAAQLCALNLLAHLKTACEGDLGRVERCVRLGGFVSCDATFKEHPKVINGASDLIGQVFGEKGKHARAAVGVSSLPLGVAVEVDGVFEIRA